MAQLRRTVPAALSWVALACHAESRSDVPSLAMLDVPLQRGVSPAVTRDSVGRLHYAWVTLDSAQSGHLYTLVEGGTPRELPDALGPAQFDGETPPKLQTAPDGSLMLSYAVAVPDSAAKYKALSGLRFTRSTDGGVTWSSPVTVADDGDLGRYRNDHTMHVARDGKVYLAWLDERANDTARVYMARSDDAGVTWSRNVAIDMEEACGCCRTPITTGPDGTVYTVWRKVLPGGIRDMVIARSTDHGVHWDAPTRVHADSFAIDHCPDAGPSIAVDARNRLHVTWWTGKPGAAGVKHTFSDDRGHTFSAPTPIGIADASRAGHAQLALLDDERVAIAWDDGTTNPARIAVRVSQDRGGTFDPVRYLSRPTTTASFPVLVRVADQLNVLWQERQGPGTPTARSTPTAGWIAYDSTHAVRLVRATVALP